MKLRVYSACLFAAGLVACSSDQHDAASSAAKVASTAAPCQQSYSFMPDEGLAMEFPFHLRSDRIYVLKQELRRGVELEYLDGSPSTIWADLQKSLGNAGYSPVGEQKIDEKGVARQYYVKKGHPKLFVAVIPDAGHKPANPAAKGIVRFSWPMQEKVTADRPDQQASN